MRLSSWMRGAAVVAACLLVGREVEAQVVRGTVQAVGTNAPVENTIVLLLDSTGARVAGMLTDAAGTFAFRAPAPGTYELRTERIGFQTATSGKFTVRQGETLERTLDASVVPVTLSMVTVKGNTNCAIRPGAGDAALAWIEAQKTLEATRLAEAQGAVKLVVNRFDRDVPLEGGVVQRERGVVTTVKQGTTSWVSVPPDLLTRRGYVHADHDSVEYDMPDANVLLSDAFAAQHCFQIVPADSLHPDLLGLAFEPARDRRQPDVKGTLWLDRQHAVLRSMDFQYTRTPFTSHEAPAGGEIEFEQLPTGLSIVQRWLIHSPILFARYDNSLRIPRMDTTVAGVHQTGGEVRAAYALDGRQLAATEVATVDGRVFDSTRIAPIAGARVVLVNTNYSAITDSVGHFEIDSLPDGSYTLAVEDPEFDALAATRPVVTVPLARGHAVHVFLATPPMRTTLDVLCPPDKRAVGSALVLGTVRDAASGAAIPRSKVTFTWDKWNGDALSLARKKIDFTTTADSAGVYRVCDVPALAPVLLRATSGSYGSGVGRVTLARDTVVVQDLFVDLTRGAAAGTGNGALIVSVSTADGQPFAGATVALLGAATDSATTNATGTVHLARLPAGTQTIDVHAAGYAPVRRTVRLIAGEVPTVAIVLSNAPAPTTVAVDVVNVTGPSAPPQRGSTPLHSRGAGYFLDSTAIARRNAASVADLLRSIPGVTVVGGNAPGDPNVTVEMGRTSGAGDRSLQRADSLDPKSEIDHPTANPLRRPPGSTGSAPTINPLDDANYCEPTIVVDGRRDPVRRVGELTLRPDEIATMQIFTSGAEVPARYAGPRSHCGAIVIETKLAARDAGAAH